MKLSEADEQKLFLLLSALREGYISDGQRQQLSDWIITEPDVRKAYVRYMKMCGYLYGFQLAAGFDRKETQADEDAVLWQVLAEHERSAPVLSVAEETEQAELIQNVRDRKLMLKAGKRRVPVSVWVSLMSMAAMFLVIALVSMRPARYAVATVVDSIDLKTASALSLQKGVRLLMSSEPIELRRGIVKIETDKGVQAVIEAPAEFRFAGPDEIALTCGRLTAVVPESGSGFTVRTNNSKIIDLGTEFGVYADFRGQTELHMFKGKTVVIAGENRRDKHIVELAGGHAVRVDSAAQAIEDIPLQPETFAHDINSQSGLIWRHARYVDLADVVGGGNGTGTGSGTAGRAIQWDGQELGYASQMPAAGLTSRPYVPVRFNPFIDGVFIPNSKGEAVKLSSTLAELNMDEFLKQDTNGLVTLMLLKQDSDRASSYWFCSREGAGGDRAKMPFLYFPTGSGAQPAVVTTADGRGADSYVTNDIRNSSIRRFGSAANLSCRYIKNERLRIIYLRFDISKMTELSGAILNLHLEDGNRKRTLQIYGLHDGPADFWDEETLDYNTAPGLIPAALGGFEFDKTLCTQLGMLRAIDNRPSDRRIVVSSDGSLKWTTPESISQTAYAITNAANFTGPTSQGEISLRLGNEYCGTRDNPSILMHANAGITFDLNAIRKEFGALQSFTASCGLSPSLAAQADAESPSASFYVLLDGQEVFSAEDMSPEDEAKTVDVNLAGQKRYLTLVTTQGTDGSIENDLCVFVKPRINFE